jgi:hypothetical protein
MFIWIPPVAEFLFFSDIAALRLTCVGISNVLAVQFWKKRILQICSRPFWMLTYSSRLDISSKWLSNIYAEICLAPDILNHLKYPDTTVKNLATANFPQENARLYFLTLFKLL